MYNMNEIVGKCDILFLTIDTLRYDVAVHELTNGNTPVIKRYIGKWEKCHTPGSFTYSAHCAFFAGFLPTPSTPGKHERLFALQFEGSETTGSKTCTFDTPDIVTGFAKTGYTTACIGGVGFFKKENPLSCALPSLFQQSFWDRSFGVTDPHSSEHQIAKAIDIIQSVDDLLFLFVNFSALHQPNYFYLPGATADTIETHAAALRYLDMSLQPLFERIMKRPRDTFVIITSDHGTAYGEDGYTGHRLGHDVVWTVPYATCLIKGCTTDAI
jgi:hypothetical protein